MIAMEFKSKGVNVVRDVCDRECGCRDFEVEDCNVFSTVRLRLRSKERLASFMRAAAAVAVLLTVAPPPAGAQPAAPGFAVQRIWTAGSIANSAGTVSVTPDASKVLIVLDVVATGASPVTIPIDQLAAASGPMRVGPIGVAPVSRGNFDAFVGFPPGWRSFTDSENREVRIGRETTSDPIRLIVAPGAMVSVVYIVPRSGPLLTVTLPAGGAVPLIAK